MSTAAAPSVSMMNTLRPLCAMASNGRARREYSERTEPKRIEIYEHDKTTGNRS